MLFNPQLWLVKGRWLVRKCNCFYSNSSLTRHLDSGASTYCNGWKRYNYRYLVPKAYLFLVCERSLQCQLGHSLWEFSYFCSSSRKREKRGAKLQVLSQANPQPHSQTPHWLLCNNLVRLFSLNVLHLATPLYKPSKHLTLCLDLCQN